MVHDLFGGDGKLGVNCRHHLAQIPDIRRAQRVGFVGMVFYYSCSLQIFPENIGKKIVGVERVIRKFSLFYLQAAARSCSRPFCAFFDTIDKFEKIGEVDCPHIKFCRSRLRNDVGGLSPFGYDSVDPSVSPDLLSESVDVIKGLNDSIEGVDSLMGERCRMGGFAEKFEGYRMIMRP